MKLADRIYTTGGQRPRRTSLQGRCKEAARRLQPSNNQTATKVFGFTGARVGSMQILEMFDRCPLDVHSGPPTSSQAGHV